MLRLRTLRHTEFERMRRRLGFAALLLVLLMVAGTVGYAQFAAEGQGFVDAFYMTVITLTTVGYSETIDLHANPAGQLFTVALLLGGMGIVAYTVPLIAAFLIEGHFLHAFTRRRMQNKIEAMSGHHIVCGGTPSALHVAGELLRTERTVVVVAPSIEEAEEALRQLGDVAIVVGDPSDDEILVQAGIERAAGVVACLGSDKDNVIVSLTARRLAPSVRIVGSAEEPQNEAKMRTAGANAVVSPSRIGGLRMASELVRPTVVSFLDTMLRDQEQSLRVEEVVIPSSIAAGRTVGGLGVEEISGALLLAVVPAGGGRFEFNPPPDRKAEPGMKLVVMVSAGGREALERHLAR
jgi:voltage-gated potassium channel